MPIKCGNGKNGCNWRGIIENWEDHASRCGYASVSCPNKCNTEAILRNTLNGHLNECPMREFICVWCMKIGTFTHITSEHEQVCLLKRVGCPQPGCRKVMERKLINDHIASNCKYSVVPCKYDSIGCCMKKRRIEISDHEAKDGEHLSLALATVQQLQQDVSALKNDTFTFKLTKYYALKQRSHSWIEDHTYRCGYNVYISVYPNGYNEATNHYLSVYIDVEEPPRSSLLQWPFKGTVTVEILNQVSNHSHYKRSVESFVPRSNHPEIAAEFVHLICHSSVEAPSRGGCQYLLGDTLYFRVTVLSASTKPWLECSSTLDTTNTETN